MAQRRTLPLLFYYTPSKIKSQEKMQNPLQNKDKIEKSDFNQSSFLAGRFFRAGGVSRALLLQSAESVLG